jgi:hypothetical protein
MRVLAYTDPNTDYGNAIVEMTKTELLVFLGLDHYRPVYPKTGRDLKPNERLSVVNRILIAAAEGKKTAEQLRALAELIDTIAPGIDAIVDPPSKDEAACQTQS